MRIDSIKGYIVLLGLASVLIFLSSFVFAIPQGPDIINQSGSGRHYNGSNPFSVPAQAGNVTALNITHVRTTEAWQGYYGNVSGKITLDDANNFTFYDWSLPNPTGEVYASNFSIVNWGSVFCVNVTANGTISSHGTGNLWNTNGSQVELKYGINVSDLDGLNETFTGLYSGVFRTGAIIFDQTDGCSLANPYVDESPSATFQEVLLTDNQSIVFTAVLQSNANGFQPGSSDLTDFEMLVLEDGHAGGADAVTSTYFFFVELS